MIEAHEIALTFGGRKGCLSRDAIESAIARPYSGYYRSVSQKAAALVQSLASNHGFVDGNKRTTLLVLQLFLKRSGYALGNVPIEQMNDEVEQLILRAAVRGFDFDVAVNWFRARIRRI